MNTRVNIFCNAWKNLFPSVELVSIFKIFAPTNSCKIIEAMTIGPIPNEIIEPNSVPNKIAKYSKLLKACPEIP